ncbi:glycerol kinase GlpK [Azospirillum halopraeferens]|uniref:glycerol kinase GlpK n=1 Tax=Azospirillum halopraeferens TaxID=34010 RepID=UPI0004096CD4|nr:glycerol kinase GlpK [Azospirillum halopraeferens]
MTGPARHLLAIDQGTTSTRAIVFAADGTARATARREFPQHYPDDGWVEHDGEDIWRDTLTVVREALGTAGLTAADVAALGITNQRETAILWDRATGEPVHRAIVWQDRRTAPLCRDLHRRGCEPEIRARTGLVIDAYFSASKLAWLLDTIPGVRERAARGALAFGTIDSFLLYRLTGGRVHATDATNASRTMLFNIHTQDWDEELLRLFNVPRAVLPEVRDSSADYGTTDPAWFGAAIPIRGVAGDQQAAVVGQACVAPGMVKSTYGTGCFALLNTGDRAVESAHRMLTTVAYRLNGRPTYALEGSIFVAGATIKWLRDRMGLIDSAAHTAELAVTVPDSHGVVLVPAFVGLGAPHWDPDARASIQGLTLDAGPEHIARAALEAVAFQTRDLRDAMAADSPATPRTLRVDGGMVVNDWLCQFLADMLDAPVERPAVTETTALGAALLAGLQVGFYDGLEGPNGLAATWTCERRFEPRLDPARRATLYDGWRLAVERVRWPGAGGGA